MKLYGPNLHYLPPEPLEKVFRDYFADVLRKYGTGLHPGHVVPGTLTGVERGQRALKQIDQALEALGKRTGDRAAKARAWLEPQRAALSAALEAFETVGTECDGPAALTLCERLEHARTEVAAAERLLEYAVGTEALRARDELLVAEANRRAVDRDMSALRAACTLPSVPEPEVFKNAEVETRALAVAAARGNRPATVLQDALEQGARAAGCALAAGETVRKTARDETRLWVCYEPAKPDAATEVVFSMRYARFVEGAPEVVAVEDDADAFEDDDAATAAE